MDGSRFFSRLAVVGVIGVIFCCCTAVQGMRDAFLCKKTENVLFRKARQKLLIKKVDDRR